MKDTMTAARVTRERLTGLLNQIAARNRSIRYLEAEIEMHRRKRNLIDEEIRGIISDAETRSLPAEEWWAMISGLEADLTHAVGRKLDE